MATKDAEAKRRVGDSPRDIRESVLSQLDPELLEILLKDHSTGGNIRWGSDIYLKYGHRTTDEIRVEDITGENEGVIRPRVDKPLEEQRLRSKEKAEVFTPAWVCNEQNNLIDEAWFGRPNVFNTPCGDHNWKPTAHIYFPEGKTWKDYVLAKRLEVSCGEAPYLTTRYDAVSGQGNQFYARVGLLDRKLRVVTENCKRRREWLRWAKYAVKSIYGFDWQGDNVLIAREHLLYAVVDAHKTRYPKETFSIADLKAFAEIISWNIWQMDGLKCVVPETCHDEDAPQSHQTRLFNDVVPIVKVPCLGCKKNDIHLHNGIPCKIMDWGNQAKHEPDTEILFRDLLK
jgi:hypothetical protein